MSERVSSPVTVGINVRRKVLTPLLAGPGREILAARKIGSTTCLPVMSDGLRPLATSVSLTMRASTLTLPINGAVVEMLTRAAYSSWVAAVQATVPAGAERNTEPMVVWDWGQPRSAVL